jgi:hypothetical protein
MFCSRIHALAREHAVHHAALYISIETVSLAAASDTSPRG